jgi:hypothetical protein
MGLIALINNGVVTSVIVAESDFLSVAELGNSAAVIVPDGEHPGVGWTYDNGVFIPPTITPPVLDTISWATAPDEYVWINTGPFKDRLGDDWPVIASSTDRECVAFKEAVIEGRQYINLKDPRIAGALDMMIATGKPSNWAMFPNSGPITPAKKAAILNPQTTEYERHIKGLPQPVGE